MATISIPTESPILEWLWPALTPEEKLDVTIERPSTHKVTETIKNISISLAALTGTVWLALGILANF